MAGFNDMIKKSAVKATDSKKKKDERIVSLSKELADSLDTFLKEKEKSKNAEAKYREAEGPILAHLRELQDTEGLAGSFHHSMTVKGNDDKEVKFVSSDKWSVPQTEEEIAAIKEKLGDKFDEVIGESVGVQLKEEVFQNEELQKELTALLGDNFDKFFSSTTKLVVKPGFNEKIYKVAKTIDEVKDLRAVVVQSKPFLK